MLPMATRFIFWIIMQAKNTDGIVILRRRQHALLFP